MGIVLPAYLEEPLSWVGLSYPNVDEDALFAAANEFDGTGDRLATLLAGVEDAARRVAAQGAGGVDDAIAAFEEWFASESGPVQRVSKGNMATRAMSQFCEIMGWIVILLKIYFLVKLAELLYEVGAALASAIVTYGASSLSIPALVAAAKQFLGDALEASLRAFETIKDNFLSLLGTWLLRSALPQAAQSLGHLVGGASLKDAAEEFGIGTAERVGLEAWSTYKHDLAAAYAQIQEEHLPPDVQQQHLDDKAQAAWEKQIADLRAKADAIAAKDPDGAEGAAYDEARSDWDDARWAYDEWKRQHGR